MYGCLRQLPCRNGSRLLAMLGGRSSSDRSARRHASCCHASKRNASTADLHKQGKHSRCGGNSYGLPALTHSERHDNTLCVTCL